MNGEPSMKRRDQKELLEEKFHLLQRADFGCRSCCAMLTKSLLSFRHLIEVVFASVNISALCSNAKYSFLLLLFKYDYALMSVL